MNNIKIISIGFVALIVAFYIYYLPKNHRTNSGVVKYASVFPTTQNNQEKVIDVENLPQRVHPVRISGKIAFAGEQVPLMDLDVRERFDRELMVNTFWHSNTLLNYKLANKYFEIIEKILKEEGVPLDFKYLAVAESGLRNVISPAGASGIWQIMKATGKEYNLKINNDVDERYHLEKATKAACDYLKEAKAKFGSWTLAAASYNVGMGRLQQRIDEQQVDNYYDLYLNTETARYLYRILAYKMVFENPQKFGFFVEDEDLYKALEYKEVSVGNSIESLANFAQQHNTTYKMLKIANPWLRNKSLTLRDGESYTIKIPLNYIRATEK